jgi:hypothetical protein
MILFRKFYKLDGCFCHFSFIAVFNAFLVFECLIKSVLLRHLKVADCPCGFGFAELGDGCSVRAGICWHYF